ncbi:MAG: hypothetical protein IPH30_17045 [Betaproteobacteria bacterium]|nr:hypothetical protein [Betaproteobacteria bacterium]
MTASVDLSEPSVLRISTWSAAKLRFDSSSPLEASKICVASDLRPS